MEELRIIGHLKAIIKNEETNEIREYDYYNKVTNAYLHQIALGAVGQASSSPKRFMMGTGTGTVNNSDTALFAPVVGTKIDLATKTTSANVITIVINYPANYVMGTFVEAGLLDPTDVLLTHVLLSPSVQIVANESITFIYTITING